MPDGRDPTWPMRPASTECTPVVDTLAAYYSTAAQPKTMALAVLNMEFNSLLGTLRARFGQCVSVEIQHHPSAAC
jgi:hypothetical protein